MEFINEAEQIASIHLHELTAGQAGGKGQKKERSGARLNWNCFTGTSRISQNWYAACGE